MSTLAHHATALPLADRPAFWVRMMRVGNDFLRGWKNEQALMRLSELTDRELDDIGLVRSDLSAVALLAPRERTQRLNTIVSRRAAEKAAHPET